MNQPKQNSTQQQIEIAGIKNGIVIMKDLSYRIVLQVASINFNLKSEMEQNSIIFQYQSFLNSLHFPIEIVIRSKKLDLTPYLNRLKEIGNKQKNELIRAQTLDYINFVGQLIDIANIMKKNFYVVVPYSSTDIKNVTFIDKIFGNSKNVSGSIRITDKEFKTNSQKLFERANIIASGIGSMGLHCSQLNTEELIELFYGVYNPTEAGRERLTDYTAVSAPIVSSGNSQPRQSYQQSLPELNLIDNSAVVQEQKKREMAEKQELTEKKGDQPEKIDQFKTPDFLNQQPAATNAAAANPQAPNQPSVAPILSPEPDAQPPLNPPPTGNSV